MKKYIIYLSTGTKSHHAEDKLYFPSGGGTNSLSPRESSLRSVCRQIACKNDYTLDKLTLRWTRRASFINALLTGVVRDTTPRESTFYYG